MSHIFAILACVLTLSAFPLVDGIAQETGKPSKDEVRLIEKAVKQYFTELNSQGAGSSPGAMQGQARSGEFKDAKTFLHKGRKYAVVYCLELTTMRCGDCSAEKWEDFRNTQMTVLKEIATYSKGFDVRADEKAKQVITSAALTLYGVHQPKVGWSMYRIPEQVEGDSSLHAKLQQEGTAIMSRNIDK